MRHEHKSKKPRKKLSWDIVILIFLLLFFSIFFSILAIDRHNRFGSLAFDLGIHDQALWQIANGKSLFNTVRGIHIFADHTFFIDILIAPLYWFFDDVRALLIFQTIVVASGAIAVYLLSYKYLKKPFPLLVSFLYLAYPAVHYLLLEDFHPENIAIPLILFAFYFLQQKKFLPYYVLLFLTMLTKEEVILSLALLGVYTYFKIDKKVGIITVVASILFFLFDIYVVLPYFGSGYFRTSLVFGQFGNTPFEMIKTAFTTPKIFEILFTHQNLIFFRDLFLPVGFLSLLNPATLVISASLLINFISSWTYAHSIYYHHVASIIPFVFISLIFGLRRIKSKPLKIITILLLLSCSLISLYFISPYDVQLKNIKHIYDKLNNFNKVDEREIAIYSLMAAIPKNASVSANHVFVPHLTHRNEIYLFPNPFKTHYWGNLSEEVPLKYVDYILVDKYGNGPEISSLINPLVANHTYRLKYELYDVQLYEKYK